MRRFFVVFGVLLLLVGSLLVFVPEGPFGGGTVLASPDDEYGIASTAEWYSDTDLRHNPCRGRTISVGSDGSYYLATGWEDDIGWAKSPYGTTSWTTGIVAPQYCATYAGSVFTD